MKAQVNQMVNEIHAQNVNMGWYDNLEYQDKYEKLTNELGFSPNTASLILNALDIKEDGIIDVAKKLLLVHSETSEATEGYRKNLMDDKLPHRTMFEVELADIVIRVMDLAGACNLDLGGAMEEKIKYNSTRADHKKENRQKENGKKF